MCLLLCKMEVVQFWLRWQKHIRFPFCLLVSPPRVFFLRPVYSSHLLVLFPSSTDTAHGPTPSLDPRPILSCQRRVNRGPLWRMCCPDGRTPDEVSISKKGNMQPWIAPFPGYVVILVLGAREDPGHPKERGVLGALRWPWRKAMRPRGSI